MERGEGDREREGREGRRNYNHSSRLADGR